MTEIDELEGKALAEAVALAQDWLSVPRVGIWCRPSYWLTTDDLSVDAEDYRPDLNIAQAWELDGEGWSWGTHGGIVGLDVVVGWRLRGGFRSYTSWVLWADFPTKANAYATARCRAFLKAKAASR